MSLKADKNTASDARTEDYFASWQPAEDLVPLISYTFWSTAPNGDVVPGEIHVQNAMTLPRTSGLAVGEDPHDFESSDILNDAETMRKIREGLADIKAGRWVSWDSLRNES